MCVCVCVCVCANLGQILVELFDVDNLEADEEDDGSGAELDVLSRSNEDPGHMLLCCLTT